MLRTVNQLHSTHTPKPKFNFGLRQTDRFVANSETAVEDLWERTSLRTVSVYTVCTHIVGHVVYICVVSVLGNRSGLHCHGGGFCPGG